MKRPHGCRLCSSVHRQQIEDWRFKDGLQYDAIIERLAAVGYKADKSLLSRHLSYVGSEVAQIVEEQMREVVRDKGTLAAAVPVRNIELCDQLVARLVHTDEAGNVVVLPMAGSFLVDLLKERRQSAALILGRPVATAAKDAMGAFAELMKEAAGGELREDEPGCT